VSPCPPACRPAGASLTAPRLDELLAQLSEGDTLKITRLDRLSRSVQHVINLGADLRARGVGLHVIEQGIDTEPWRAALRSGCSPSWPSSSAS
jgi:hypothetical protein